MRFLLENKLIQLFNEGIFVNIFVSRSEAKKASLEELLDKYRKVFDIFVEEIVEQVIGQLEEILKETYPRGATPSEGRLFISQLLYPSFTWQTTGLARVRISPLHKVLVNFDESSNKKKIADVMKNELIVPLLRFIDLWKEVNEISDARLKLREVVKRIIENGEFVDTFTYLLVNYLEEVYFLLRKWLAEFLKEVLILIRENGTNLIATFWSKEE
jgi:hypothetical protein